MMIRKDFISVHPSDEQLSLWLEKRSNPEIPKANFLVSGSYEQIHH